MNNPRFFQSILATAAFALVLAAQPAFADCIDGQVCRASTGVCDVTEYCGNGGICGPDTVAPFGLGCRAASGEEYDVAEFCDGVHPTCPGNEVRAQGKNGGYFRMTFPDNWDGDLVIINHGFDLNPLHIRPHHTCGDASASPCYDDVDCTAGSDAQQFCNDISYTGLDDLLLPQGKAVAAGTYSSTGWAVFDSAKDIKDMMSFAKKNAVDITGTELKRVIITGFSLGGAVTGDAILKLKIQGAVPLCAAVGGGLPTWDVAMDVRLVYDFLCDNAPTLPPIPVSPKFNEAPDYGLTTTNDSDADAQNMALKVNGCFGWLAPSPDSGEAAGQAQRLSDFIELTQFTGYPTPADAINIPSAMGFATLGLGDFVRDPNRLDSKKIGFNTDPDLDYSALGGSPLAGPFDDGVKRLTKGAGRKTLNKYSNPNFLKGKGKKVNFPILMMAGANDWLVIPEFERVFTTALADGSKPVTQTWIDTFGHCVFTEQEVTATFNAFFAWLGPYGSSLNAQPTKEEIHTACLALPGATASDCNFNDTFTPNALMNRIPAREDWPEAAAHL
ncbi:MAG TPA: hypothetical protein VN634_07505 [Candidatus Limnocylindrales bacterium]|nr:hypothetical protein [Candidatus Limnocylindrales bacterium]